MKKNKREKNFPELGSREEKVKKSSSLKRDEVESLKSGEDFTEKEAEKKLKKKVPVVHFAGETDKGNDKLITMSPIDKISETESKSKVIESDMTEVFRSRSFSPDVRRKIFKLPDMNKPMPPKRKQSKNRQTLKMLSKMKVTYPCHHRSRLDEFGSNVKFLQDKIKRKFKDDIDYIKPEFGDDVETVRTIKRNKNGEMSIHTDRYVRLGGKTCAGLSPFRATYPDIGRRSRLISGIRSKQEGPCKSPRSSSTPSLSKTPYFPMTESRYSPSRERLPRNAPQKENSSLKKSTVSKSSSSPCPSVSSYKSGKSGKSPISDKGSNSSLEKNQFHFSRTFSPVSSASRVSSPRSPSPGLYNIKRKTQKLTNSDVVKTIAKKPVATDKPSLQKCSITKSVVKPKEITSNGKTGGKKLVTPLKKGKTVKKEINEDKKVKKMTSKSRVSPDGGEKEKKILIREKPPERYVSMTVKKEKNEIAEGRDLVRTDSFFQNLFLRRSPERKSGIDYEKISSVLERARMYQRRINWPETYKSEPSLSLVTYYLNQKRPVSFSKFKRLDRDYDTYRLHSPLGSFYSENFQTKLRRFDSLSQFDESSRRGFSPEGKERSSSEPPFYRSGSNTPEDDRKRKQLRDSQSEISSIRSSPTSSRSPSCRRIRSQKILNGQKLLGRAKSAGELENDEKTKTSDLTRSTSSLNLSNVSDHTEYQAYVLELMHSSRKCKRFRELHKFYSNLEKMEELEKTASTGDLRPRFRNEEIIDFDRWKKVRTKERAEAELKTLVENLFKVQKEKDLLFRATDVEAVRWKGDRGLRIKERSVEDLKEQFNKFAFEELESDIWKQDFDVQKDNYKSLWKGNSVVDVAKNLNNTSASYRGRPLTLEDLEKIEKTNARIGKEYGYSLKAWSSLSNEQINFLKDQLNDIYGQDLRRKGLSGSTDNFADKYEVCVPKNSKIKSPGEGPLQVRCSSAMSKSNTLTPTIKRKESMQKEWKKADSISALPVLVKSENENGNLLQLPWKEDVAGSSKYGRSFSETRHPKEDHRYVSQRSKSASSQPLSEDEKKQLSMTLSREIIEKMSKSPGKGPILPRETLGALAAASGKLYELNKDYEMNYIPENRMEEPETGNESLKSKFVIPVKYKKSFVSEPESGSGSSETSVKTVIRKNSIDVSQKVQYFEDLRQSNEDFDKMDSKNFPKVEYEPEIYKTTANKKKKSILMPSSSLENLNDYFGHQKQYATTSPVHLSKTSNEGTKGVMTSVPVKPEDVRSGKNIIDDGKFIPVRYNLSSSPVNYKYLPSVSSNESLFSYRSRSVSPDPTKYYRAYLKMVKCGAVRKLCNKFESWEDLLSLSSDKDFWLPPAPRRFASDPELTRDMLRRFGTDPSKVTVRGQEVGDVRWLRTKFEKEVPHSSRGRSRVRRVRSPLARSPITVNDRYMPRINVISKKAELQLQGLDGKNSISPSRMHELPASPENYKSLIDYTKDHGGYYFSGEVEKLKRKFERLQDAERLSILGQMYTSTPDVNELRNIAPYLECSWVAHRYPGGPTSPEPEVVKKREMSKSKSQVKPRPHSSSPIRTKKPLSILKPSSSSSVDRSIFADQKFDPTIHRPKYRYQPEREVDRRCKRNESDRWCTWNKPTVTFKGFYLFICCRQVMEFRYVGHIIK